MYEHQEYNLIQKYTILIKDIYKKEWCKVSRIYVNITILLFLATCTDLIFFNIVLTLNLHTMYKQVFTYHIYIDITKISTLSQPTCISQ